MPKPKDFSPPKEIVLMIEETTKYARQRTDGFGSIESQLDMLYDDIDDGLFSNKAKNGKWYKHIKSIKDSIPKPKDLEEIKKKLATEMENA